MASTQLERETLESKDRDALVTMATALGGKPSSRARKAEIVDLILEMTAGTKGSSNGSKPKETQEAEETDQEEPLAEWEVQAAEEEVSDAAEKPADNADETPTEKKKESSENLWIKCEKYRFINCSHDIKFVMNRYICY